jgi:hypothetical protein
MKIALLAAASLLALAACEGASDPEVCSLPYMPASISVAVQDSISGANVTPGAKVVIREGAHADSAVGESFQVAVNVGYNRAGTYTVTVRQAGYQTWTRTGVKVADAQCYVQTVVLTARLQPAA